MLNNRVTREKKTDTQKPTVRGEKAQVVTLDVHSQQPVIEFDNVHMHVCILDRKSPRRRSRAGEIQS